MNVTPMLRASLFRLLLMITLLCGVNTILLAQPANDSCKNATQVIPVSSVVNTTEFNFRDSNFEFGSTSTNCRSYSTTSGDIWVSFFSTNSNFRLCFSGLPNGSSSVDFELYTGTCANRSPFYCGTVILGTSLVYSPTLSVSPGSNVLIRLIGPRNWTSTSLRRFGLAVQDLGNPAKLVSTATGGNWHSPSTWVQNRIPNSTDSVVIADGSTVTVQPGQPEILISQLEVGQSDSNRVARLKFVPGNVIDHPIFRVNGDVIVQRKDSVVYGVPAQFTRGRSAQALRFNRDLRVDGGIHSFSGAVMYADSMLPTRPQRLYGTGTIRGNIGFACFNRAGVNVDIPIQIARSVNLYKGRVSVVTPFRLVPVPGVFSPFSTGENIFLGIGSINKPCIPTDTNLSFYTELANTTGGGVIPFRGDTTRHFSAIVSSTLPKYSTLDFGREKQAPMIIDRSLKVRFANGNKYYYKIADGDTITSTYGFNHDGGYAEFIGGITDGTICLEQFDVSSGSRGKRTLRLFHKDKPVNIEINHPLVTQGGFVSNPVCFTVLPQKPTGTINASGARHVDWKVMKLSVANNRLINNSFIDVALYTSDSLNTILPNCRLAQAASPNGPWSIVSDPGIPVISHTPPVNPDPILTRLAVRSKRNIDFSLGEYFTVVDLNPSFDLRLVRVLAPPASLAGHCGPNRLPIGIQVINQGNLSSVRAVVKTQMSGPNGNNSTIDTLQLRSFTGPVQADTIFTNARNSPLFGAAGIYSLRVTLVQDNSNQLISGQDSIELISIDTRPKIVPYLNTYKTVLDRTVPAQHWTNQTMLPKVITEVNNNGFTTPIGLTVSQQTVVGRIIESMILTEPISVQAGRTLQLSFNWFPIRVFGGGFSSLDSCYIEYTTNCGNSYTTVSKYGGPYPSGFPRNISRLPFKASVVLPIVSNGVISIRLRNVSVGAPNSMRSGVVMDSLRYEYVIPSSVAGSSFTHPLTLYPNPATAEVSIMGLSEELTAYTLINNLGQVVRRGKASASDNKIPLQGLPRGLYTVATERERLRLVVE